MSFFVDFELNQIPSLNSYLLLFNSVFAFKGFQ